MQAGREDDAGGSVPGRLLMTGHFWQCNGTYETEFVFEDGSPNWFSFYELPCVEILRYLRRFYYSLRKRVLARFPGVAMILLYCSLYLLFRGIHGVYIAFNIGLRSGFHIAVAFSLLFSLLFALCFIFPTRTLIYLIYAILFYN